jgi:hypothetical protein
MEDEMRGGIEVGIIKYMEREREREGEGDVCL